MRPGTPWRDFPKEYGAWHTMYMRWQRGVERGGGWHSLLSRTRLKRMERHLVFLDSTGGRVHQPAAGAPPKRGPKPWAARAVG